MQYMTHKIELIRKFRKNHTDVRMIVLIQFILITAYKNIALIKKAKDNMTRGVWTFSLVPSAVVSSAMVPSAVVPLAVMASSAVG